MVVVLAVRTLPFIGAPNRSQLLPPWLVFSSLYATAKALDIAKSRTNMKRGNGRLETKTSVSLLFVAAHQIIIQIKGVCMERGVKLSEARPPGPSTGTWQACSVYRPTERKSNFDSNYMQSCHTTYVFLFYDLFMLSLSISVCQYMIPL